MQRAVDELLHPIINPASEKTAEAFLSGLPAGPGGACGKIVFTSADAVEWAKRGETVILVREETNPEDVEGMRAAEGMLTARGGMPSHAALVARGWGKCCIVGAGELKIDLGARRLAVGEVKIKESDLITLNGTKGKAYAGALGMMDATENPRFQGFMKLVDKFRTLGVRTNADTPQDASGPATRRRRHRPVPHRAYVLAARRRPAAVPAAEMILSKTVTSRKAASANCSPCEARHQGHARCDGRLAGHHPPARSAPARVRATGSGKQKDWPRRWAFAPSRSKARRGLHETNPMMGHRGAAGHHLPEVTEMQIRAIFESAAELKKRQVAEAGTDGPVTCDVRELDVTRSSSTA